MNDKRDELLMLLCNRLLESTAATVRLTTVVERQQVTNERTARAVEDSAHHIETSIPAIMQALGVVREQTGQFNKEETPTALRIWDRFANAPARVQWLAIGLVILIALSGWAHRIAEWAFGR